MTQVPSPDPPRHHGRGRRRLPTRGRHLVPILTGGFTVVLLLAAAAGLVMVLDGDPDNQVTGTAMIACALMAAAGALALDWRRS